MYAFILPQNSELSIIHDNDSNLGLFYDRNIDKFEFQF